MWKEIKDEDGTVKTGINQILKCQTEFYEKLYKSEGIDEQNANLLLSHVENGLTDEQKEMCERNVTLQECEKHVQKLKIDSSPGIDGITNLFYKQYWNVIKEDFIEVVNEILSEEECCPSQYIGVIVLHYKDGDRGMLNNWRPITLLNCDFKIIEKIIAGRMKMLLPYLVKEDQKAYIENVYIGDAVRLNEDVIKDSKLSKEKGAILYIDQSKAFDRVEMKWLYMVLEKYGFGEKFISWIKTLYKEARCCVSTNGYLSRSFRITRGVRQGSPLSAYLYILQAEPLANMIRKSESIKGIVLNNERELKITAYADDTQGYVKDQNSVNEFWRILEIYSKASGAKINEKKTKVMMLNETNWQSEREIKYVEEIKALGVMQGHKDERKYWNEKIEKCENKVKAWKMRHLTYRGKVQLIQSMVMGCLRYPMSLKTVPREVKIKIEKLVWSFVWDAKTELVKRTACVRKREFGGLGVPDLDIVIDSSRIKMLLRIIGGVEEKWKILPRKYLQVLDRKYGIKYFVLHVSNSNEELKDIPIPEYYKEMIMAWQRLKRITEHIETKENVLNQIIWCNDHVKVNGKVLVDNNWSKVGIKRIKDVMNSDGTMRINEVKNIAKNKAEVMFKLNRIKVGIPKSWKERLKNQEMAEVRKHGMKWNDILQSLQNGEETKMREKTIYNEMIRQLNIQKSTGEGKWEEILGREIDWKVVYIELNRTDSLRERKEIDFNWKCIQNVVWTEQKLKRIGQSNGLCSRCGIEEEDLEHLLYMCECNENIWLLVEGWIKHFDDEVKITIDVIILGYRSKDGKLSEQTNFINMIIDIVKWHLWKYRNDIKYNEIWSDMDKVRKEIRGTLQWKKEIFKRMKKDKIVENIERILNM